MHVKNHNDPNCTGLLMIIKNQNHHDYCRVPRSRKWGISYHGKGADNSYIKKRPKDVNMVKQKVVIWVFGHAEFKFGVYFELSSVLQCVLSTLVFDQVAIPRENLS